MKQKKSSDSELVTKGFLKSELESELGKLRRELGELEERMDKKAQQYRDQVLTKMDGMIKEFEIMREDRELGAYQTSELRNQVEEHEKRITRLEKHHIKT